MGLPENARVTGVAHRGQTRVRISPSFPKALPLKAKAFFVPPALSLHGGPPAQTDACPLGCISACVGLRWLCSR